MTSSILDSICRAASFQLLKPEIAARSEQRRRIESPDAIGYRQFRRKMIRQRQRNLQLPLRTPNTREILFSLLTTVWDTDPVYLYIAARSALNQRRGVTFEWVILDNGSTRSETSEILEWISRFPEVRIYRVDANLGIINGMRYCLERARGRYVLPFDSDDYLYPDCLSVIASFLAKMHFPPIAFTDEDKLVGRYFLDAYLKPDWDPVLFANSCYIAHLGIIAREHALELGAYTDRDTEGSHDWDTFTRFYNNDHIPVHIPEVLYSWREHAHSTAGGLIVKPYVYESQRKVLTRFLGGRRLERSFEVRKSPLFAGTPDWWLIGRDKSRRPVQQVILEDMNGTISTVAREGREWFGGDAIAVSPCDWLSTIQSVAHSAAAVDGLVYLTGGSTYTGGENGMADAIAQFELFPDTAIVGGRIFGQDDRILSAGLFFGFGQGCDCPDRGRSRTDPGYFAQMWKQHSVSAVSAQNMLVSARFLSAALDSLSQVLTEPWYLGAWLGAVAAETGRRVVYTPLLEVRAHEDLMGRASIGERQKFLAKFGHLIPEQRWRSRHLGLTPEFAYWPQDHRERSKTLAAFTMQSASNSGK